MLIKNMGDNQSAIIVRLQGTNAAIAKELIDNSGMPIFLQLNFKKQQIK
jgi:succinyl-CoA synthetase beta subunit